MISNSPIMAEHIELWPLDRLSVYERNPRFHSESQIEQIASSIDEFGFTNPIMVNPEGTIIVGTARYFAARERNLAAVPVIVLKHLTKVQQRAYRIADNQLALNATWDEAALRTELEALLAAAFAVDLVGFVDQELQRLLAGPELRSGCTDEDAVPEPVPIAVSLPGDLWRLDDHMVLCGDATFAESLRTLLGEKKAAMAFTDPPYNVQYGATRKGATGHSISRPIANNDLGAGFGEFMSKACENILATTIGAVYVCMSSSELHTLHRAAGRRPAHQCEQGLHASAPGSIHLAERWGRAV